jgi:hypothetical protein
MIQKFWSDMTYDEKLDVLRNDIECLFTAINSTNSNVSQLDEGLTELFTRLTTMQTEGRQITQKKGALPEKGGRARVRLRNVRQTGNQF